MALVTVFLLAYVGYQIWRYVTPAYKTETAFTYTVTETASVNGVVLRDEVLLDNSVGNGVASYLVGDGAKVAGGTVIAEIYRNKEDARNIEQLRALEKSARSSRKRRTRAPRRLRIRMCLTGRFSASWIQSLALWNRDRWLGQLKTRTTCCCL